MTKEWFDDQVNTYKNAFDERQLHMRNQIQERVVQNIRFELELPDEDYILNAIENELYDGYENMLELKEFWEKETKEWEVNND